jgi:hypothetical protein
MRRAVEVVTTNRAIMKLGLDLFLERMYNLNVGDIIS